LTAAEGYRFALSNSAFDACTAGAKTVGEMRQNLAPQTGTRPEKAEIITLR